MLTHARLFPGILLLAGAAVGAEAPVAASPADGADRVVLRNEYLSLGLSRAAKGAIVSLLDGATGVEVVAETSPVGLFVLAFTPSGKPDGERLYLASGEAEAFACNLRQDGPATMAELTYAGFRGRAVEVQVTARLASADPLVRWRLAATFPEDLVLEEVQFPGIQLRLTPSGSGDDAAVLGLTKGGVARGLSGWKMGQRLAGGQPGSLAAQFACCYGPQVGFYSAAYDGKGCPKRVELWRTAQGVGLAWKVHTYAGRSFALDFDLVHTTFRGPGQEPPDWRDAADIYKQWALTQPWCATPYAQRPDIPAWMKAGPAMVRFGRDWLADPDRIDAWMTRYWARFFPNVPLIVAFWGWEKVETWVTPDYFPVFPSDEQFQRLVASLRQRGAHAFAWPSGYHWTVTYGKQPDGSFQWDDRQRFAATGEAHAVAKRNGSTYLEPRSWLRGGETSCLCPGDPWTIPWWNEQIAEPLARRGCELVQVDQVVGGVFPACFRPTHGHPLGSGPWVTEAFTRQLETLAAACRRIEPDSVIGFEEPNEWFNHLVGIQDYRDCESPNEWASVFGYLYHEFLPVFQSNPHRGDRVMTAHCLVTGQVPHLVPRQALGGTPALVNGDFETSQGDGFSGWAQVTSYQGRDWVGRYFRDSAEKHSGATSMRLENRADTDIVQVSQNVHVGEGLVVGRRYRLSAWTKTESMARPNVIMLGLLTNELKSTGPVDRIVFAAAGAGWVQGASEFSVPPGTDFLRIMAHVDGPCRAWVDDVCLEEVVADGTATMARLPEAPAEQALLQQWVDLFYGEGRPYLLLGRMVRPPRVETGAISYRGRQVPAVFANAFRAADGSEAMVLANASATLQNVKATWRGRALDLDLAVDQVLLVR